MPTTVQQENLGVNKAESAGTSSLRGNFRHPRAWRPAALAFASLGVVSLLISSFMSPDAWGWLGFICVMGLMFALHVIVDALRDGAKRAIADHFLVLVGAFSLYFLLGPLLLVFGPEELISEVLGSYPTQAKSAVVVTTMNLFGMAIVLLSAGYVPVGFVERSVSGVVLLLNRVQPRRAFWTFLLVGGYCSYEMVVFDLTGGDELLSGLFRTISQVVLIAILIGAMDRGRGSAIIRAIALFSAFLMSLAGLLSFSKAAVLHPWLVFLFGVYLRRPLLRWVFLTVVIIAVAFTVISRPVGDARNLLLTAGNPDFSTRLNILETTFAANSDFGARKALAGAWARLCYTPSQDAAIDLYDNGDGGDDVELMGWVLLPRALFPQKPVITRSGPDLNFKISGLDTSATGVGLFVNGYYNLGWFGLVMVSVLTGVVLAIFSAASRVVVASGSMLLLPIALLGAYTAFRVDGHFIADIWGTFGMVMVPLLLLGAGLRPRQELMAQRFTPSR